MARTATVAPVKSAPATRHEPLGLFVGAWNLAGVQLASRVGPAAEISGTERYAWLEGGHFLVHHFDARVGHDPAACVEIIGQEPSGETYSVHTYYSNGQRAEWELTESDGVWTIRGEWAMADGPAQVRCTIRFTDEGNGRTAKWESSTDGSRWEPFWDVRATRA